MYDTLIEHSGGLNNSFHLNERQQEYLHYYYIKIKV